MNMRRIYDKPENLFGQEGTRLGPTDWLTIDQARINGFADVTGDHQWIHVGSERAAKGPFGATIAHGYLTLSLVNYFLPDLIEVRGFTHAVNIGADRLRFLNPVKVDSHIRAIGEIIAVEDKRGAVQSTVRVTVQIAGEDEAAELLPACVLDTISRYYTE